jgi:hypothetical protein
MPLEANDRGLAEHRLDDPSRTDRVVADGRSGARARVRDEDHALADSEGWRRLLPGARRPPWGWRWSRHDCHYHGGHDRGDNRRLLIVLVFIVIFILIVVDDDRDDVDLDIDLVGVDQLDGTLGRLGRGSLGFVLFGVIGGVGWFFGHSGSRVRMGRLRRK